MKREELAAFLFERCRGKYKAMSADRIMAETGTSWKALREQVNALRREGIPIASGGEGYYYAETARGSSCPLSSLWRRMGTTAFSMSLEKAVL